MPEVEEIDPTTLKVAELRAELEKRGLETKGLKAVLVKRLKAALSSEDGQTEEAPRRSTRSAKRKKQVEEEPEEEEDDDEEEEEKVEKKKETKRSKKVETKVKKGTPKLDSYFPYGGQVYVDGGDIYDVMLNQTNISQNNNKFYVIQLIDNGGTYYVWNRWGRVGEPGQNNANKLYPMNLNAAIKDFEKKFKDKTANDWSKRHSFVPKAKKYTLLDMSYSDDEEEEEEEVPAQKGERKTSKVRACTLAKPVQNLIKLIFDNDMFKESLEKMNIDTKKMPLGKISKTQIAKGFEVLEDIEDVIKNGKKGNLNELSSKFYTLIPHSFGRSVPPPIKDAETLQQKMDLLEMLGDIEVAQAMMKEVKSKDVPDEVDHPLDVNYKKLKNEMEVVEPGSEEYKMIEKYLNNTKASYHKMKIVDIFKVDRQGEKDRFAKHEDIENRKLLWHGTSVAVMVAILTNGLRIMPHSGGRVGRGLYFASENAKSANYVGTCGGTGIMLLNEIALGKEYSITQDDPSLRKAPSGYDSVVARGRIEPDPKQDTTYEGDFGPVTVPQGKAINMPKYQKSSFYNSEYLVYSESQVYTRYVLRLEM